MKTRRWSGKRVTAFNNIKERLTRLRERDMYRRRRVVTSPQGPWLDVDGRKLLNFCSNDYLGLAGDQRIRDAFKAGIDNWGSGAGASHLVSGHTAAHHALEEALADFTGRARALLFSSGYAANLGVINALLGVPDHVFEDRLNHASLLDGGRISRAGFHRFAHADMDDLETQLSSTVRPGDDDARRRLIVSDGTFSMDGDLCPLADMVPIAHRHQAWIMIDDAHGFGVLGDQGRGLVDPAHYSTADVPVLMATLGKGLGTFGAFVAGDEDLIETLIQRARTYIYTTALPSAVAVATLQSLKIVTEEGWRRDRLRELVSRFRDGATALGVPLLPSDTPIQPILVGDPARALALSAGLEERGMLVTAIRPPTVPVGTSRLRVTLTAAHEDKDIDSLLEALGELIGGDALATPGGSSDSRSDSPSNNDGPAQNPAEKASRG
jgi:8-amino-7-oxononanoate synthase